MNGVNGKFDSGAEGQSLVATFGPFEVELHTGELRKHGQKVRLQKTPFHILRALLENPGRVVTREDLRGKVWPSDTYVDFEGGLNTAVNRLRAALGDSAENPIYIETLARVGYRFVAPVSVSVTPVSGLAIPEVTDSMPPDVPVPITNPSRRSLILWASGASAAVLAALLSFRMLSPTPVVFRQLTFSRGVSYNARFTSHGGAVVYDDSLNGKASGLFVTRTTGSSSSQPRELGYAKSTLAGVSPTGEIAFLDHEKGDDKSILEEVSPAGGPPTVLSSQSGGMDWSSRGALCLLTHEDERYAVEFPPGHKIYTSLHSIDNVRVSPNGNAVAFLEHPIPSDDGGRVMITNLNGKSRVLSDGWESIAGLAWSSRGNEVWFTAAHSGVDRALMAVDLTGRTRQVAQIPGGMLLRDINSSGDVLIARNSSRMTMLRGDFRSQSVRDISWLDWSTPSAISRDGNRVLFDESGQGGGSRYTVYLYRVDARVADRLGDGRPLDLSADGTWALIQDSADLSKLSLVSIPDHRVIPVSTNGLEYRWARFLPATELSGNRL